VNDTLLGGAWELALGESVIPASLLGDITPNFTEGTRSAETLGGNRTTPSGRYDESTLTFTMFVPNMDYLKAIWPDNYNAPTEPQEAGNLVFGSGSCTSKVPVTANLHQVCDDNSNNDMHMYAVLVAANWNPTINPTDPFSVEVTVYVQPNEDGNYFQLGAGSLTEPVLWDAETQAWVPVGSS
jgi:hypothetical protein